MKWCMSEDCQEATKLFNNGYPLLMELIHNEAISLKVFHRSIIPLCYNLCMDDHNHVNQHHTFLPSVYPPPPKISTTIQPPIPATKEMEMEPNGCSMGEMLMNVAKDGSEDGVSDTTKKSTCWKSCL